MSVLTHRQALENRIIADARNIATWRDMLDRYKVARLPYLVTDCAVRFVEAKRLAREGGTELLRAAEHNLVEIADLWKAHSP